MTIVNSVKSVFFKKPEEEAAITPPPESDPAPGPDEVEEDQFDREGNTDPDTNQPPAPQIDEPEDAMLPGLEPPQPLTIAELEAALNEPKQTEVETPNPPVIVTEAPRVERPVVVLTNLSYVSIAGSTGRFHAAGIAANGKPFSIVENTPPNATLQSVVALVDDLRRRYEK